MAISILDGTAQRKPVHLWAPKKEVEPEALAQLQNVASLPWVFHHVAAMADCHSGKGATVGSVIAMKNALSPATVGVDLGCGMAAVKTFLRAGDLPDNLEGLRSALEAKVPVGFNSHAQDADQLKGLKAGNEAFKLFARFGQLDAGVQSLAARASCQLGTLGGGNHFIELCLDTGKCSGFHYGEGAKQHLFCYDGKLLDGGICGACKGAGKTESSVWLMLHSGSRNIGKELADIHISKARTLIHNADLPDPDLAVFLAGTPEMASYRADLNWAQEYAWLNRLAMLEICQNVLQKKYFNRLTFDAPIACHHNYISEETHFGEDVFVTRKGAISARKGELGIVPGSMGTSSFIVRGLGNPDSFHSASHGAGRRMSRTKAKKTFTLADLEQQTAGVCCRKDAGVLDEISGAYKDVHQVMRNQADLVEVVTELKQVLTIKG